ncbi:MAG: transposase [Candidatus Bathyarchaeota archaeon]|nr:transposase [Candidatus Bathyarchaeota archaeon]
MLLSYKYRLNPTKDQIVALEEQLRLCRWTYNGLLNHSYEERRAGRGTPTQFSLQNLLPELKTRVPELERVFSQVLQNIAKRVRSGFEGYWARRRAGLKATPPHFRRIRDYSSLTYPQYGFKLVGSTLRLSKIGALRVILHRPVGGRVKTLTISRSPSGKWYAVFSCEVESKPIPNREKAVGVDLGLNSLVALSDGTLIEAPRSYRKSEGRLRKLHRRVSRRCVSSNNWGRARLQLAVGYERVANQRRDYAYKAARCIVDRYERIYVEDLKIQNMQANRCLSKSIADAGWGLLRNALTYMAGLSEGVTAFVDPRDTSQICSGCGVRVEKDLAVRVHVCPRCGLVLDRDVNAARNILKRGLEIGRGPPEYTPVGEVTATRLIGGAQVASVIQEAHDLSHG